MRPRNRWPALPLVLFTATLAAVAQSAPGPADRLTPQERRGQQIYRQGIGPSGQEITALLGSEGTEIPASVLRCANCHGHDGHGRPEGGVTPSNITWEALTKPYGVAHQSGRQHPPYTERSLKRAVTMGLDPAGSKLHGAMPRYRMAHQDLADLIAYLKRLGESWDPGLTGTTVRVGTILPPNGRLAEVSQAVRAVLTAYFEEINRQGGIYNRRIDLRFTESSDSPEESVKAVGAFLEDEQVFALTGSFTASVDEAIAALIQEKEVPLVGAVTLYPQVGFPLNRYVFYLYSGLIEQGRALAAFAAERYAAKNPRTAIVYPDEPTLRKVAEAIRGQCQKSGWDAIEEVGVPHGPFNTALPVQKLSEEATEIVFFLGPSAAGRGFLQEAQKLDWRPIFLVPCPLAGREMLDAPAGLAGRIFLSFPTLSADQSAGGRVEYRRLAEAHHLPSQHLAAQWAALSSAKVLVEGLKRAGRDVSREKLIETLEGLYEFQTGFTPPITYGPNRRVGALGAYIVSIDPEEKGFVPISGWIEPMR